MKTMNNHRGCKSESHPEMFSVCYSMIENYVFFIFTVAGYVIESKPVLTGSPLQSKWVLPDGWIN